MSSFTEYHKKWKEENGKTEDSPYRQRNIEEIQKSTEQYVDNIFGKQGTIWDKVQNTANNNLTRSNNVQSVIDRNTRNQMAQNMADFTNRKKMAMQSVSNIIQENAKKREQAKQENQTLIDQANEQFRKQHSATVNTNQKQDYVLPKAEVKIADTNNTKDLKLLDSKAMFNLTDGEIDKRSNVERTVDSITGIGGNLLMGLESVVPSMGKYIITGGEVATGKAINTGLEKIFGAEQDFSKVSENLGEQIFDKVVEDSTLISKEKMQEEEKWRKETIANNIKKTDTALGKKIAEIVPSVGQNIIPMAISYFNPVAGTALFMSSAAGNYLDDAEERGMNKEQALTYATVMGSFEGITEQVVSGKMLSNSMKIFNGVGLSEEVLNSFGVSTAENFFQEVIMEPLQEKTAEVVGGEDKANWDNILNRSLQAGVDGVLSSLLLNGASVGIASASNVLNKKNPTQKEIQVAIEDTINSNKVDIKNIVEGAKEGITKSQTIIYKDYNTNQPLDSVSQQWLNRANNIINENNPDIRQNATNNPINPLTQQTNSQENKVAQNGSIEQANDILNNKKVPMQNYVYEESDNAKINNLRQGASKYFNNTEKAHNYINMLEKIIIDKNIDIRFDDNLMTSDGKVANGSYSNGVITINPNSTRAGEFIAIHELTHAIGTDAMRKIVDTYRKSNAEFDNEVKSLLKNYNATELTDEAMADVSAQIFGNQDFINNIAQSNPNVFQKIYSEIKYLWHQFRGYKNQDQFVEDLYYKWTQAYNNSNKLNNTSNYHISQNLSNDIDNILKNINERNPVRLRDYTPSILVNNGIKDLPMYENPSHIRKNILTDAEAQQLGLAINLKDHYHGLGKETYIKAIDSLDDPRVIFKNKNKSQDYLILTIVKDSQNNNIVVPIQVETETYTNNIKLDINRVKTVFGYDRINPNLDEYIKYNIKNNNLEKIYEKKKPSTNITSQSASTNSISSTNADVNTIKYSTQESENNSGSFNLSKNSEVRGSEKLNDATTLFEKNMDGLHTRNNISEFGHSPENTKYSQNNNIWKEYLENNFESTGTRTNLKDIRVPISKEKLQESSLVNNQQIAHNDNGSKGEINRQNQSNNVKEETNTTNQLKEVEKNTKSLDYEADTEGKQRKHYKSVMESDEVGETGKQVAKDLLENDTYTPLSNTDTLAKANETINRNGAENVYVAFKTKMNSNERITVEDIAIGERLIQIFSQNGDMAKSNELIQDVAMLGTELGQMVQAMSLIKKLSPEGQLIFLNKIVDRLNLKENADLKITEEMSKRILETKSKEELEGVMNDIATELGEQLPVTRGDKVRSWRYLSMLGNPRTHGRNALANVVMNITQQMKNKIAGATEDVVGAFNKNMERTKTLRRANKDQKSFAKQDAEFMRDKIDGGGKYDIKNAIQKSKKQFNNKILNSIANFNSKMLEWEDNIFLKIAYKQAMQNYMTANKLSSSDMKNSSILQKAREYASYQAQEATFHQFSSLAQRLTEIENKGGIAGKMLEAVVPFKKTPINIAKSGVEYSPIGLAKSLTYDLAQLNKKTKDYKTKLEKGLISEADYKTGTSKLLTKTIDNVAKGMTGTSLALIGYALADMGMLKAGNDGEDDDFKEKLGEQEYAIRIGDNTFTLDWVSPSAIPMFMGATIHDLVYSEDEDNSNTLNSLMTSSAKALEPMTEMSMLQGLTSAISSYEQGSSNMIFDLGASAVSSYLGQFVPTALGQVAKTIDDKERDTSSTEKGIAKKVDQFTKQQIAKVPIASTLLPTRKDVWGNEKTRDSNPLVRAYETAIAPYNRKKVVEDYTEKELLKVFEDTGEKSVLPGIPNKDITINKQKYRLTAGEYNKAKESFGKTSKSMLDSLVKTNEYKQLSDEQKATAIDNIYSYAKEKIKIDYAKGKKQEVETSSMYNILNELKSSSNQSEYLNYSAKIQGVEKDTEKKEILAKGKYSETTKETIYKNTLGKKDDIYNNLLAIDNININEYLNYKLQNFESDKEDDGTVKGETIKGSKPKKLYNYVNNMNIKRNQKLAIIGTQYKLDRDEQKELYNYISNIPGQTQKDKLAIFSKYGKNFTIYKDNTITFK